MSTHGASRHSYDLPPFTVGDWLVTPMHRRIDRSGRHRVLEPRHVDVLAYLAMYAGEVVSVERLLEACWGGGFYGDNPVHKTVAMLRKALGDDARAPRYIATVRKRGYQLVAPVAFVAGEAHDTTPSWNGGTPYPGPRPYAVEEAGIFFGRSHATATLRRVFIDAVARDVRLVVVSGPSGSGKSSLIRAGLMASLLAPGGRDDGCIGGWLAVDGSEGMDDGIGALVEAFVHWRPRDEAPFAKASATTLRNVLRRQPTRLLDMAWRHIGASPRSRLVILADHADRLPDSTASGLASLLTDSRVVVVVACRSATLTAQRERRAWTKLLKTGVSYVLPAPSAGEVAAIIREPARLAGLRFGVDADDARQLDDVLLHDAWKDVGSLAALQDMLHQLYQAREADGTIPFAAYRSLGGIDGAAARRAAQCLAEVDVRLRTSLPRLLRQLVTVSHEGQRLASRILPWQALDDAERQLADHLVEARLLTSHVYEGVPSMAITRPAAVSLLRKQRAWPEQIPPTGMPTQALAITLDEPGISSADHWMTLASRQRLQGLSALDEHRHSDAVRHLRDAVASYRRALEIAPLQRSAVRARTLTLLALAEAEYHTDDMHGTLHALDDARGMLCRQRDSANDA